MIQTLNHDSQESKSHFLKKQQSNDAIIHMSNETLIASFDPGLGSGKQAERRKEC